MTRRLFGAGVVLALALAVLFSQIPASAPAEDAAQLAAAKADKRMAFPTERQHAMRSGHRMDHPNAFRELHRDLRSRDAETGPEYPANYRMLALTQAQRLRKGAAVDLPWQERGPANVAGRARAIVVDPGDPNFDTWLVASVGGGIWKTTDAGQSWTNLTNDLPNLAMNTLVQAASNPDVLYAGTGEGFGNIDAIFGSGIFKSTDRGATWTQLASTAGDASFNTVQRLIVDPNNPDIVLAATAGGGRGDSNTYIYRSTDGGTSWTEVLRRPAGAGFNRIEHLIATPGDFNTMYATLNSIGVQKSTDGGQTWSDASSGLGGNIAGRMELAIAPNNPSRIYMSAQGPNGSAFLVSNDAAATWVVGAEGTPSGIDWLGAQGWYDNTIAVHPYNENVVYVGGVDIAQVDVGTIDASGADISISVIADVYGQYGGSSKGVHPDQHGLVMVPTNPGTGAFRFLNTNDGGVSFSDNQGGTFQQTGFFGAGGGLTGLNTSQYYGADKMNGADRYIGGTQDNGSFFSPENPDATTAWIYAPSGDGFEAAWHYAEPDWMIETVQFNLFIRTLDGGANWESLNVPGSGPFLTRLAKSNQDPDLIFGVSTNGVIRSEDFGTTWTEIDMPGNDYRLLNGTSVRISLADPNIVWAGSEMRTGRNLYVSQDAGLTFSSVQNFAARSMASITDLATHPTEPNTGYALFSQARSPKILKTTDLGQTWTDITGFGTGTASTTGFPDVAVYSFVVMPHDTDELWAGTDIGLFISKDGGASWQYADNGLPAVSIWQMRVVNDEVVVATHGRGVWTVALPELSGYEPPAVILKPVVTAPEGGLGGEVDFGVLLRSDYDSTVVFVDEVRNAAIGATTGRQVRPITLDLRVTEPRTARIVATGYRDGTAYPSTAAEVQLVPFRAAQFNYVTDFSAGSENDFLVDGMEIRLEAGFSDQALHTDHPYPDAGSLTAQLLVPIVVSSQNPILSYDDVALIEEGDPGTVFGDQEFWDYVIVEGSSDGGGTWIPLADGYDADFDAAWSSSGTGNSSLFVNHQINLLNTFSDGEEILIRFRLFADDFVNGWGWAIDNLMIQPGATDTEAEADLPTTFALEQNYPNPFNPTTTIQYRLGETAAVTLTIFDVSGRRVRTLLSGQVQGAGGHRVLWDGRSDGGVSVASGTYLYRLEAGDRFVQTRRMVLVK